MNSQRIRFVLMALAGFGLAGPAFAQAPSTPAAPKQNVPTPPDADEAFLTGLRRVGVLAGQAIQCSPEADRKAQISDAMELADQVALHFGLRAAFSFVGATGYGSGHPFDKSVCPQALESWKGLVAKYLNK